MSKKFKLGDKVVPHSKSVSGCGTLEHSNVWRQAKRKKQPFLYVVGIPGQVFPVVGKLECYVLDVDKDSSSGDYFNFQDFTLYKEPKKQNNMPQSEFKVSKEFILEAHKSACSEWKQKLEKQFPDAFEPSIFEFNNEYELSTSSFNNGPLLIADGMAPDGLERKCLLIANDYDMKTTTYSGRTYIYFEKKKSK